MRRIGATAGPGPMATACTLASQTEDLRQENRRLQALLRVSRKIFRSGLVRTRKAAPRPPQANRRPAKAPATPPTETAQS